MGPAFFDRNHESWPIVQIEYCSRLCGPSETKQNNHYFGFVSACLLGASDHQGFDLKRKITLPQEFCK
jgi:hypothetical protein